MGRKFLSYLTLSVSLFSFNATTQAYPQYFGFGEADSVAINDTKDFTNLVHVFGWNEEEVIEKVRLAKSYNLKAAVVINSVIFGGVGHEYRLTEEKKAQWYSFIQRLIAEGYLIAANPEGSTVMGFYLDEPNIHGLPDINNQAHPGVGEIVNLIKGNWRTSNFPIATAATSHYRVGYGETDYKGRECLSVLSNYNCRFIEGYKLFDWIGITDYESEDEDYINELRELDINYPDKKKLLIPKSTKGDDVGHVVHTPNKVYEYALNNSKVTAIVPFDWGGLKNPQLQNERDDYKRIGYEISYKPKLISQSAPSTMYIGELYPVSITIKNEGSKVWRRENVKLGTKNPDNNTIWGTYRLDLPRDVAPGETVVINEVLGTPATGPGVYPLQVQMVAIDNGGAYWIGNPSELINVTVKHYDSEYYQSVYKPKIVSQSVPSTMYIGGINSVSITLKNEGTQTWQRGKVRLATRNPDHNIIWGSNRLDLPYDVAPGQTVVVSDIIGTPTTPGTYPLQVQLIVDEQYWIGSPSQLFNVNVKRPDAAYYQSVYKPRIVSQSVPPVMYIGGINSVSITLKNEGTQTWQRGKVRLATRNPDHNIIWGSNRLDLPHDVAPGQTVVVSDIIGTPTTPGTYPLQVQLIVDEQYWIGSPSQLFNVIVINSF